MANVSPTEDWWLAFRAGVCPRREISKLGVHRLELEDAVWQRRGTSCRKLNCVVADQRDPCQTPAPSRFAGVAMFYTFCINKVACYMG